MGLDLSSIEGWTHELLEELARKRGIRNPEFRRHAELVRLLFRQQYGDRLQTGREHLARGVATATFVRKGLGALMGNALESAAQRFLPRSVVALLGRPSSPPPQAPLDPPDPRPDQSSPVPAAAGEKRASGRPAEASSRVFIEPPQRTRAMARLLAAQGHRERALAIYADLLAHAPSPEPALRTEMDEIARGQRVESELAARPTRARILRMPPSAERLVCEPEAGGLRLQWSVTADGLRRARAVLAEQGELALRLLCIERDPQAVVQSRVIEHGPIAVAGEWSSPALEPGQAQTRYVATVGVRAGDRFVAIVHTSPKLVGATAAAVS